MWWIRRSFHKKMFGCSRKSWKIAREIINRDNDRRGASIYRKLIVLNGIARLQYKPARDFPKIRRRIHFLFCVCVCINTVERQQLSVRRFVQGTETSVWISVRIDDQGERKRSCLLLLDCVLCVYVNVYIYSTKECNYAKKKRRKRGGGGGGLMRNREERAIERTYRRKERSGGRLCKENQIFFPRGVVQCFCPIWSKRLARIKWKRVGGIVRKRRHRSSLNTERV